MLFGLTFAWITTKVARRIYQYRMEISARINLIRDRNYKIRHAVEAITPVPYPRNQQAIRVIREEVDRIEWALTEIAPRVSPKEASTS
jgi:NADH:ubiquinone oxidoreductase subunit D